MLSLLILWAWDKPAIRRRSPLGKIPAPLLVVGLGVGINALYSAALPSWLLQNESFGEIQNNHLVQVPVAQTVGDFFNFFSVPDFAGVFDVRVLFFGRNPGPDREP